MPVPTLPEALAHGHTLTKLTSPKRTADNFCTRCGAWYAPVSGNISEPVQDEKSRSSAG